MSVITKFKVEDLERDVIVMVANYQHPFIIQQLFPGPRFRVAMLGRRRHVIFVPLQDIKGIVKQDQDGTEI